ncbi:MAG: bifunctional [glutamate--ammonia ligase]-adenylyl-L-tyrosine phosphorylase/[glutamate--ammonia-ligase] adenylyltransferase [Gammaproteobacteria bacterium]|nr:bifunctional [glutamate--ammonia ligase]-adenylyl-L-tyrosine phosphorylase/[glutamate--ammonia-ligase] adenylyltransferase [Gammaproteobacteria bacterium]
MSYKNQKPEILLEQTFSREIDEKVAGLLAKLKAFPSFVDRHSDQQLTDSLNKDLNRLFSVSEFCYRVCMQHPEFVDELFTTDDLSVNYSYADYYQKLSDLFKPDLDDAGLNRVIRQFRNQQMLRLAWRDMVRNIDVKIILAELSYLADACINVVLETVTKQAEADFGQPLGSDGRPMKLVVLAMGKLGAFELNYSSDIDLIFCYSEEGQIDSETKGRGRNLSHSEFFTRLCRNFVRLLNDNNAYGFVYRVDTRLRPFGNSGQLALSFDAMEIYYERHGREWERYAMIKARAISTDADAASEIMQRLHPFVYRRYLDFGAFASLREMKELIEAELKRKGASKNVKLGPGGIREIEFIGQAFQLIRGGRTRELQIRGILDVLQTLRSLDLIPEHVFIDLTESYVFLRKVENAIQAFDDRQTHTIPDDNLVQARLAYAVGYDSWISFETALKEKMQTVHETFEQIFSAPQLQSFGNEGDSNTQLIERIWTGSADEDESLKALTNLGYKSPEDALRILKSFHEGGIYKSTSPQGRQRIDKLMPLIITSVAQSSSADVCLLRLIALMEAIARRSAYIALLSEHPMGLSQLVKLVGKSEWISNILIRSPILLDELLDPRRLYETIKKEELEQELNTQLRFDDDDVEQQMRSLSEFKQSNMFRVAASELNGALPVNKISDHLTYIAEVVVAAVEKIALKHMQERFGDPQYIAESDVKEPNLNSVEKEKKLANFCVIAYGKLGGIELGFSSDLDLVFLHDSQGEMQMTSGEEIGKKSVDNGLFFARVAQRIMHFLNTRTQNGVLYEVDTRLRPSGGAGILVSNLQSFSSYQHKKAWTWEHQALIRARAVTGSDEIVNAFNQIRYDVLTLPRDIDALRSDVREMRLKMRKELYKTKPGLFNIKQSVGGITDIEFIIQFLALAWANKYPQIIEYSDNLRIIESLVKNAILSDEDAKILTTAYLAYRETVHINTLRGRSLDVELSDDFKAHQQGVEKIWDELMEQKENE